VKLINAHIVTVWNFAGSFVSLMMGLTFGGLSGYGAYLSSKDSRNFWLLFCTYIVYVWISLFRLY